MTNIIEQIFIMMTELQVMKLGINDLYYKTLRFLTL